MEALGNFKNASAWILFSKGKQSGDSEFVDDY